jgi:peptidoglycan hydrolase-like protein with peptidoglycan-binding domain
MAASGAMKREAEVVAESGAILLGVLGCGVAVFAVDYAMSEPGDSWFDQIKAKLESHPAPQDEDEGKGRRRTPTPKRIAPPSPHSRTLPPHVSQTQRQPHQPQSFTQQPSSQTWQAPPVRSPMLRPPPQRQIVDQAKATAQNLISKTFGGPPSMPKTKSGGADFGVQETQHMLNTFFQGHVIKEDGKMGPRTKDAIVQFQQAQKLPQTGIVDQKTHDFLVQISTPLATASSSSGYDTRFGYSVRKGTAYWASPPKSGVVPDGYLDAPWGIYNEGVLGHAGPYAHVNIDGTIVWIRNQDLIHHAPVTSTGFHFAGANMGGDWKAETASLGKAAQDIISHAISEGDPRTLTPLSKLLAAAGFSQAASASHSGHSDIGPGF